MKELFQLAEDKYIQTVNQDQYRLKYHLMPYVGWLNDPNGLCQFKGVYHIFYQYSPLDPNGSQKGWGHYSTKDFIHYMKEENPLFPDSDIDKNGAYSGSAFIKDNQMHIFYTGNIKFEGNYDYINEGRGHYVNYMSSEDGLHFSSKECLLKNSDYPGHLSCHVRDPKVFEEDGYYYLVLGARTRDSHGELLIYKSDNLKDWSYFKEMSVSDFGYMWECPDLFELDQQKILITCPQGVKQDGYHYENVYQNGYFLIKGKMEEEQTFSSFHELDKGFDFYAPQTFLDEKGRRILIGWMGLPDTPYTNPTVKNYWQHALTLPRELTLKNDRVYQYPVKEIENLRKNKTSVQLNKNEQYNYQTHVCEIDIKSLPKDFKIDLRKDVQLSYHQNVLTLSIKESGYGRDQRHLEIDELNHINIFSDTSSLEIFINHGEAVMTLRVYDQKEDTFIQCNQPLDIDIYELGSYTIEKRGNE